MKKEVITTAKTIEEAVALAVRELGAPDAEKIEYTVLEEPKKGGLFLSLMTNWFLQRKLKL